MVWHCWPQKTERSLDLSPSNTWLPGTTSTISYWFSLTLPHTGVWMAQVTTPWGTMAAPGFKNEIKKGMKESHSKSSLPFSYTGLLSVSTLGPLDLNFLTLGCFPIRRSQGWLLPILQTHCKHCSLKKPLPRHPSKATYPQSLYHWLGFICPQHTSWLFVFMYMIFSSD